MSAITNEIIEILASKERSAQLPRHDAEGRDEDGPAFPVAWVRHHDRYGDAYAVNPKQTDVQPEKVGSSCCSEHK